MPDWRHAIARRLEGLRLRPTREAEVVEELAQHLDDRYHEHLSGGASEERARRDPLTYAVVLAVVTAGGFLATYLPAHRVVSIDPASVLKRE